MKRVSPGPRTVRVDITMTLNPGVERAPQYLLDKHYFRKHGANAYYGQGANEDH